MKQLKVKHWPVLVTVVAILVFGLLQCGTDTPAPVDNTHKPDTNKIALVDSQIAVNISTTSTGTWDTAAGVLKAVVTGTVSTCDTATHQYTNTTTSDTIGIPYQLHGSSPETLTVITSSFAADTACTQITAQDYVRTGTGTGLIGTWASAGAPRLEFQPANCGTPLAFPDTAFHLRDTIRIGSGAVFSRTTAVEAPSICLSEAVADSGMSSFIQGMAGSQNDSTGLDSTAVAMLALIDSFKLVSLSCNTLGLVFHAETLGIQFSNINSLEDYTVGIAYKSLTCEIPVNLQANAACGDTTLQAALLSCDAFGGWLIGSQAWRLFGNMFGGAFPKKAESPAVAAVQLPVYLIKKAMQIGNQ